jgi:hypothetical protein
MSPMAPPSRLVKRIEEVGVGRGDGGGGGLQPAELVYGKDGHRHQGGGHQEPLEHIGPGDRQEAPNRRVEQDREGPSRHRPDIGQAEYRLEELTPGHQARAGVDQEEDQHEQGGDPAQPPVPAPKRLAKYSGRVRASPKDSLKTRSRAAIRRQLSQVPRSSPPASQSDSAPAA